MGAAVLGVNGDPGLPDGRTRDVGLLEITFKVYTGRAVAVPIDTPVEGGAAVSFESVP